MHCSNLTLTNLTESPYGIRDPKVRNLKAGSILNQLPSSPVSSMLIYIHEGMSTRACNYVSQFLSSVTPQRQNMAGKQSSSRNLIFRHCVSNLAMVFFTVTLEIPPTHAHAHAFQHIYQSKVNTAHVHVESTQFRKPY